MVKKWIAVGMAVLLVCLAAVGCGIPQEEHDAVVGERDTALAKVASLESDLSEARSELEATESYLTATEDDLAATQSDLAATQSDLADAESQISSLKSAANKAKSDLAAVQGDYEAASTELNEIKEVYPPRDFTSVTELEAWVRNHVQPYHDYLDEGFRAALIVQAQGLEDGYLISVVFDEDDTEPGSGWILCGALVNGTLYMWNPEETEVYSYADYDFTR